MDSGRRGPVRRDGSAGADRVRHHHAWREVVVPQFTVNPSRFDPYKNFKFRVQWEGRYVAGVSRVSALRRVTEVVEHREGGDPSSVRKSPGRTKYEPITLERGVTHDAEFEEWANKVWSRSRGPGNESSLADFRRDIRIELFNEAGQLVIAYNVYRCWVSRSRRCPTWTPTRARPRSRASPSSTRASSVTSPSRNRRSQASILRPERVRATLAATRVRLGAPVCAPVTPFDPTNPKP